MAKQNRWWVALVSLAVLTLGGVVRAGSPAPTTITIADLECQGCAKKVTAKLREVPGVAAVQVDVQARTATVTQKPQTVVSCRALWEAVEKAGKQPTRLEGPAGTFTAKPQS